MLVLCSIIHIWVVIPRSFSLSSHILRAFSSEVRSFLGAICCWAGHIFISYGVKFYNGTSTLHAEKYPPLLSVMESSRQQYWNEFMIIHISSFLTLPSNTNIVPGLSEHPVLVFQPFSWTFDRNIPCPDFYDQTSQRVLCPQNLMEKSSKGKWLSADIPWCLRYLDEDWMPEFQSPRAFWQVPLHEECWPPLTEYKLVHGHTPFSPCSSHSIWPPFSICAPHLTH